MPRPSFLGTHRGYLITSDHSSEKILKPLTAWSPLVAFELHQTVKLPKPIEISIAVAKQRAAMAKK